MIVGNNNTVTLDRTRMGLRSRHETENLPFAVLPTVVRLALAPSVSGLRNAGRHLSNDAAVVLRCASHLGKATRNPTFFPTEKTNYFPAKSSMIGIHVQMRGPHFPTFTSGDFVAERGSDVRGHIIGEGEYPGEWRIRQPDGSETTSLAENLVPSSPHDPAPSRKRGVLGG